MSVIVQTRMTQDVSALIQSPAVGLQTWRHKIEAGHSFVSASLFFSNVTYLPFVRSIEILSMTRICVCVGGGGGGEA